MKTNSSEKINQSKAISGLYTLVLLIIVGVVLGVFLKTRIVPQLTPAAPGAIISGSYDTQKFKSEAEWQKILTPEQYHVLREQGTELPFTGELLHNDQKGTYFSVGCDQPVFRSEAKFDSGTGWPSFTAPVTDDAVVLREDHELGETRVEVLDTCGGHLGHVFDDGPPPTGKRYCMNSVALRFVPDN